MSTEQKSASIPSSGIGGKIYPMRIFGGLSIALIVYLGGRADGFHLSHLLFFTFVFIYPHVVQLLAVRLEVARRVQMAGTLIDAFAIGAAIFLVGFSPIPTLSLLTIALANGMALGSFGFMTATAATIALALGVCRALIGPPVAARDIVEMDLAAAVVLLLYFIYFAWVAYRRTVAMQGSRVALRQQKVAAEIAKTRSDRLLLAILPESAAREYEARGAVTPVSLPSATILIADACGFGEFADRVGSTEAIASLNATFKAFDAICRRHGLEPLRSSGDAYLAVASGATSADLAFGAALEMRRHTEDAAEERRVREQEPLVMRFALHSGEVLAAVIETEKFSYDLFGETIALAFEVERMAPAGGLALSATTLPLLTSGPLVREIGKMRARRSGREIAVCVLEAATA